MLCFFCTFENWAVAFIEAWMVFQIIQCNIFPWSLNLFDTAICKLQSYPSTCSWCFLNVMKVHGVYQDEKLWDWQTCRSQRRGILFNNLFQKYQILLQHFSLFLACLLSIRIDLLSHYFQMKNIAYQWQKAVKVPIVSYRNMQIIILHFQILFATGHKNLIIFKETTLDSI